MSQFESISLSTPNLSVTNFDLPSLHLLHDEILAILKDTETHLSEFNDDLEQAPLLLDSIDVLKQLSCVFELMTLAGAQVLTSAIAHGLQHLYDGADNSDTALIMDLSEAIMTLDRYVEFILLTETVEPSLLLPIINKLNAYGDGTLIDESHFTDFGNSSVVIANPEANFEPLSKLGLDQELLTNAYRSGLNVALLHQGGSLTDVEQKRLKAMSSACALIAAHSQTLFWQAAAAAVNQLETLLPLTLTQKHTLIYLEQQFHHYLPVMDARFADLVALACQRDNPLALEIKKQYARNQLNSDERLQMNRFLFGPNRQVTDMLNDLIQGQINGIKDEVDSFARGESMISSEVQSAQITEELSQLASTMRLLGLNAASDALKQAASAVKNWQTPTPSDFDQLLLALMSAENAIITMAKMRTPGAVKLPLHNHNISLHQLDTAYETLVEESRTALASAEQALNDYLADSSRDALNIQNTPEMLRQVSGAARFLRLPISASMLSQLASYIDERLAANQPLNDSALAYIADVMMSVDYRLESFEHNRPVNQLSLDVAQRSLSQLLAA
ncbi:hypothetical protein [Psychrobacter ciconiae]|uniref:hypothetical protein n=1 Tax=Psychrobacter ciconiae TaxID=1553449 RepID=UPI001918FC0A|nr:hypothetical protein [Psychrobacter ciconiae]